MTELNIKGLVEDLKEQKELRDLKNKLSLFFDRKKLEELFEIKNCKNNFFPALKFNILNSENKWGIELLLPGIQKENLKVTLNEDSTLCVSYNEEVKEGDETYSVFRQESFKETWNIPSEVDLKSFKSEYNNGILTITANKQAIKEPIEIKIEIQ